MTVRELVADLAGVDLDAEVVALGQDGVAFRVEQLGAYGEDDVEYTGLAIEPGTLVVSLGEEVAA